MKESTKEFLYSAAVMILTVFLALVFGSLVGLGIFRLYDIFRPAEKTVEETETVAEVYRAAPKESASYRLIETYTEGDGPAPEWYDPDEPMAVEWEDKSYKQVAETNTDNGLASFSKFSASSQQVKDIGCPDWNVNSTLWGWDGHHMEVWEMDVFSRIFFLEFWQPNVTLCEAGCDAMLRLWEKSGGTMYESLSYINENGSYSYSTFPDMWEQDYDSEGLAWCRSFCEERFYRGPVWTAEYFRKGQYHDWGEWTPIPAYEIDGVFFSTAK